MHVASGVPQGTVQGPLLFLCYINDLPLHVDSHIRLFADDCLLYRTIRNHGDHLLLQKDLDALTLWTKTWGMSFNANKCYILPINKSPNTLQPFFYQLNNTILKHVQSYPYLGVTIQHDLKYGEHVTKIVNKASKDANQYLTPADPRTRGGKSNFKHISAKLEQIQNSFFPRTIRDWNSLPSNIREETKLDSFKRNLNSIPDQPGPRSRRD